MDNNLVIIVLLAATAGFLLLRLRSILGTRTGFEDPNRHARRGAASGPAPGSEDDNVVPIPRRDDDDDSDIFAVAEPDSDLGRSLKAIKDADPTFNVRTFIDGSKAAYEMLLTAFETGDRDTLRPFLSDEVYEAFVGAMDQRDERGVTVEMRFIGFRSAEPIEATFAPDTQMAEVTMRFVSEVVSTSRNAQGDVIEGDPQAVQKVTDVWTFARNVSANDPNWILVATGA